ncbi:MAG: TolC family protein, partial [Ferruginibacter sp.]
FLSIAEENSPLLNDFNNQILANKIDSIKLRALYGINVTGEGSASYAPVINGWGYDNALTNGQTVFAGAKVQKTLIGRNQINTRLASFNAIKNQLLSLNGKAKQTIIKQVTDQYIATFLSQQLLENANYISKLLQQEDLVLQKLTRASAFKQTDYLSFKVTMQQTDLARQQLQAELQSNYLMLNLISGIVDTTITNLEVPQFKTHSASFDSSIYRQTYVADSIKISNDAAIINYDYKPKISAFSDAGYQSSLIQTSYKNFGISIGFSISLPLYDGHTKKMLLTQNDLLQNTKQKYFELAKKQYEQAVLQLKQQIINYQNIILTAQEHTSYVLTLVEANAKQLPTGDVKTVDFIMSINNYLNLKVNIIQYQSTLYALQNQLNNIIIP